MNRRSLVLGPTILLFGCAEPPVDDLFTDVVVTDAADASEANSAFVELIDEAEDSLEIALPTLTDLDLADAIVAAQDRGVAVRFVTDVDQAADEGVVALLDADVPVRLADSGIGYFDFSINEDVAWPSDMVVMSHSFAIADDAHAVSATRAGDLDAGDRVVLDLRGEELLEDLWTEHNQVFGGSDAAALTAYDDMAKSIADLRWSYGTHADQRVQMWLGPQERLTKRIIDAIYAAKSSIRVLTNDFANDGMAKALEDKAAFGFDAQVVVGPNFGDTNYFLSLVLETEAPHVDLSRVTDAVVPTIVLIDYTPARNGRRYPSKAFVLSHDIYAAARLYRQEEVLTDQLIDGNLWVFEDWDEPSGPMLTLESTWQAHFDRSEAL